MYDGCSWVGLGKKWRQWRQDVEVNKNIEDRGTGEEWSVDMTLHRDDNTMPR